MHLPPDFAVNTHEALEALLAADPFVTLATCEGDGAPLLTQLPVLLARDGDGRVLLEGHWARPNRQAQSAGVRATVLVHGPHAYVSPSWYTDKDSEARVPTWNYLSAELEGRLERYEDETGLIDLLERLSAHFETQAGSDWRFNPDDPRERVQVRGIVGFRFSAERVRVKHKLNQNHPDANREAVAERLAKSPLERERMIGKAMRGLTP